MEVKDEIQTDHMEQIDQRLQQPQHHMEQKPESIGQLKAGTQ